MPAPLDQVFAALVDRADQRDPLDASPAAFSRSIFLERDDESRAVEALGDARGDDPDHTRVPLGRAEHDRHIPGGIEALGHHRERLLADLRLDPLTLAVARVEPRRPSSRARPGSCVSRRSSDACAESSRPEAFSRGPSLKPISEESNGAVSTSSLGERSEPSVPACAPARASPAAPAPGSPRPAGRCRRRCRPRRCRGSPGAGRSPRPGAASAGRGQL